MKASTSGIEVRNSPGETLRHAAGHDQLLRAMAAAHAAIAVGLEDRADAFLLGRVDERAGVDDHHVGLVRRSGVSAMPALCRWPAMISESTRFFAQPSETSPTFTMVGRRSCRATVG